MKQFEAERLHALQQGHDGVLPGAVSLQPPDPGNGGWRGRVPATC